MLVSGAIANIDCIYVRSLRLSPTSYLTIEDENTPFASFLRRSLLGGYLFQYIEDKVGTYYHIPVGYNTSNKWGDTNSLRKQRLHHHKPQKQEDATIKLESSRPTNPKVKPLKTLWLSRVTGVNCCRCN